MFLRIQHFNEFSISKNEINFYKFNQVFDEFGPLVNSNFGEFTCLNFEPKKAPYLSRLIFLLGDLYISWKVNTAIFSS